MITIRNNTFDKIKDETSSFYDLLRKSVDIYKYEFTPDNLDFVFFEMALNIEGVCGITKKDNGTPIFVSGGFSGELNDYGIGKNFTFGNVNFTGTRKVDKDIYVCKNNKLFIPNIYKIRKYSRTLDEIDKSLNIGIIHVRMTDLIGCEDDIQVNQINEAIEKVVEGKVAVPVTEGMFNDYEINVFSLRKDNDTRELVDLLQVREDVLSRYCHEIGVSLSTKIKKAQVSEKELSGYEYYSAIDILDGLEERQSSLKKSMQYMATILKCH